MPLGAADPGTVLEGGGAKPATLDTSLSPLERAQLERRAADPLAVGFQDLYRHATITAADLNAGAVRVAFPAPVSAYQITEYDGIVLLVGHDREPRNDPGGYDDKHQGNGELVRHIAATHALWVLALSTVTTDVELHVYGGRYAARLGG